MSKLPIDLMTWGTFQAEFALSPLVAKTLENILETQGAFLVLPGQRTKYVSRKIAFRAFEDFARAATPEGVCT